MSTEKCGPDNCPIITFSVNLTPAEQRVERGESQRDVGSGVYTGADSRAA